jgi:valyl-tRNA synthetase
VAAAPGNDIALSEEVIARGRNFANKIWNASRLLFSKNRAGTGQPMSDPDRWILSRVNECARLANEAFKHHRYHEAADAIWTFFWDEFCDFYISNKKDEDWSCAYSVYESALRLLHPIMPFVTEELWHRLHPVAGSIALAPYPQFETRLHNEAAEEAFDRRGPLRRVIDDIREYRAMNGVENRSVIDVKVLVADNYRSVVQENRSWLESGTRTNLTVPDQSPPPGIFISFTFPDAMSEGHRARIEKENEQIEKVIANSKRQLDNPDIVRKMPEKVVATMRAKLAEYEAQLAKNRAALGE